MLYEFGFCVTSLSIILRKKYTASLYSTNMTGFHCLLGEIPQYCLFSVSNTTKLLNVFSNSLIAFLLVIYSLFLRMMRFTMNWNRYDNRTRPWWSALLRFGFSFYVFICKRYYKDLSSRFYSSHIIIIYSFFVPW